MKSSRHDLVWYNATASREDFIDRLKYLEPSKDFRTFWQYQNLMYLTAGYLAGYVNESTWEELVQKRILDPLEMNNIYSHEDYAGLRSELKAQLLQLKKELGDTDEVYPELQAVFDKYWDE